MTGKIRQRCGWAVNVGVLDQRYHDREWGVPVHRDRKLFEFLVLEGAQAGLSWSTILKKREGYREAFARFDPEKVARFSKARQQSLMKNPGIVRNRLKIESTVSNAQAFLNAREQYGSFSKYLWGYVDGEPVVNRFRHMRQVPATSALSERLSKDLKQKGFRFVGSTIIYAYLQAVGIVNDHLIGCFRRSEIIEHYR
ncbi:MAG: DNA-3-methyladenine glycosylase I [Gammaproteobacteria bacterium]